MFQDPNVVITVAADDLEPNGARSSACTVVITKFDMFSF